MGFFIIAPALAIILYLCYTVVGTGMIIFAVIMLLLAIVGGIGLALDAKEARDEFSELSKR